MSNTNGMKQKAGCLAPDTMVIMADGSNKRIADVRMGDRIIGDFTGESLTVSQVVNVWVGPEWDNMVEIYVDSIPNVLLATKTHPIWVQEPDGTTKWKLAGDCKVSDKVFTKSGEYAPITWIMENKAEDRVYNLGLKLLCGNQEYEGTMYCNDIRVGDFEIQNRILKR